LQRILFRPHLVFHFVAQMIFQFVQDGLSSDAQRPAFARRQSAIA